MGRWMLAQVDGEWKAECYMDGQKVPGWLDGGWTGGWLMEEEWWMVG